MATPVLSQAQLEVELAGLVVTLKVVCANHYDAMKLHDELIRECQGGAVTFSMRLVPR
jgi:hypothetical protein